MTKQQLREYVQRWFDCYDTEWGGDADSDSSNALREVLASLADEPSDESRALGEAIRQCVLRKQAVPEVLALAAISLLDPTKDPLEKPWCDNCGQDRAAHIGPEMKCPPENRT